MATSKLLFSLFLILALLLSPSLPAASADTKLFREYIGAQFNGVKFSDLPINSGVEFHFILSFAIDYTTSSSPSPTNGQFNVFWDTDNLSPSQVTTIKQSNDNVKVALSIGGATVQGIDVNFDASSIDSWVSNAVSSLTKIIKQFDLDGVDIDYEQFIADPVTFAECIGQLLTELKKNGVISFASIAPFDNEEMQSHYQELWKRYGDVIDYVNFQFYAYDARTTVSQFLSHLEDQRSNYKGGKVLVSFSTDSSGGLKPDNGFLSACKSLKKQGKLDGIFVWSADDSMDNGFLHEKSAQALLASGR